jgi:hypothetical protein
MIVSSVNPVRILVHVWKGRVVEVSIWVSVRRSVPASK